MFRLQILSIGMKRVFIRAGSVGSLVFSLLLTVGCDNGLVPIRGVVTLDGEPLQHATVTFMRTDQKGRPASGLTGDDGSFDLTTYQASDGLPPGDYRVLISKVVDGKDFKTASSTLEEKHRAAYKRAKSFNPEFPQFRKILPALYEHPTKTPFSCTVPLSSELRCELESDP